MIKLEEYQKKLSFESIKPVNLVMGEEEYFVKTFVDKMRTIKPVRVVWGDEISLQDFINTFTTGGMFTDASFLFVYNAEEFLSRIKDAKAFASYLQRLGKNKVFFYVKQKLSDKELQREPYATLTKLGDVIVAGRFDRRRVKELVLRKFQREGISIEEPALEYLLEASSYDLMLLKGETDKLVLLGKKSLSLEDVKRTVVLDQEYNIFEFLDAFFLRNIEKTLQALDSLLRSGTAPLQILAVLVSYSLRLLTLKEAEREGLSPDSLFAQLDIKSGFQAVKFKGYLSKNSLEDLRSLVKSLYLLDLSLKVFFANPEKALRDFVVKYLLHEEGTGQQEDQGD